MCRILILVHTGGALAKKFEKFKDIREKCRKRTANQAERMLELSSKKGKIVIIPGTSVRIPVPLVDRAKCDQRNILAVVMECRVNEIFILGTKFGVLEGGIR